MKLLPPRSNAPRWVHRLFAFFGGYFWMPCPICRQMFGGHEKNQGTLCIVSVNSGQSTCPTCTEEAHRRTRAFFDSPEGRQQLFSTYNTTPHWRHYHGL